MSTASRPTLLVNVKHPEPVLLVPGTLDVDSATVTLSDDESLPDDPTVSMQLPADKN